MNISKIANTTKIIVLNVLFVFIVLFVVDYSLYLKLKHNYLKDAGHPELFPPISYIENYKADFSETTLMFQNGKTNNLDYFRPISGEEYKNKSSILIFGCSFAHSYGLENNQTISEKLSQFTKRTVYNFGMRGGGIQHMFHILKNEKLYNKIENEPEHIMYIYIPSHLKRLQSNIYPHPMMTNGLYLQYKLINNSLKLNNSLLNNFSKSFVVKSLYYQNDINKHNLSEVNKEYNKELAKKLFIESKKLIKEKYPNIKFTILKYEVEDEKCEHIEQPQMWEELKKEGFTIIKSSDLIGRKYKYHSEDTTQDDYHPSEAAWDLLVPPLIGKLNL